VTFTDNGDGTATLSGTPAAGTGGIYDLTFTASNGIGSNAVQNFTLAINQPPAITSGDAASFVCRCGGNLHRYDERLPGASDHTWRSGSAGRCDLH
jgi:hypothetical protein